MQMKCGDLQVKSSFSIVKLPVKLKNKMIFSENEEKNSIESLLDSQFTVDSVKPEYNHLYK